MPAILTHYTFGLSVIEAAKGYKEAFLVGNQGPDTFMAYGTNPFHKREDVKAIRPFGAFMHHEKIDEYYARMMEFADKSERKEVLYAYILGLFAHFSVDRACHPYIFYRSGFDEKGGLHGFYGFSHGKFEALVDKILGKRKGTYIRPDKAVALDEEEAKEISRMWAYAAPDKLDDMAFYRCLEDFQSAERMLWTRTGLKRILFRALGKYSTAYSQSHPRFIQKYKKLDLLNDEHSEWKDPCTEVASTKSFEELLDEAREAYKDLLAIVEEGSKKEGKSEMKAKLKQWVKDIDHDGMPYGSSKKVQCLCWKKK